MGSFLDSNFSLDVVTQSPGVKSQPIRFYSVGAPVETGRCALMAGAYQFRRRRRSKPRLNEVYRLSFLLEIQLRT